MITPAKNWRNGATDCAPPIHHADPRPCFTGLRMGNIVAVIRPGPLMTGYWADDKFNLSQAVGLAKLDYSRANQ